jgi:hypothetical protein
MCPSQKGLSYINLYVKILHGDFYAVKGIVSQKFDMLLLVPLES